MKVVQVAHRHFHLPCLLARGDAAGACLNDRNHQSVEVWNQAVEHLALNFDASTWIDRRRLQLLSGIRQLIQPGRQFTGRIRLQVHSHNELVA